MTAVRMVALWCDHPDGCSEEFMGERDTRHAREQARAKGWTFRTREIGTHTAGFGKGRDLCPEHSVKGTTQH